VSPAHSSSDWIRARCCDFRLKSNYLVRDARYLMFNIWQDPAPCFSGGSATGLSVTDAWGRAAAGDKSQRLGFSLRSVGAKPDVWPRPSWAWGALTDSAGQKLAYVYFEDEPGRRRQQALCSPRPTKFSTGVQNRTD
jgi:hypothetical protein